MIAAPGRCSHTPAWLLADLSIQTARMFSAQAPGIEHMLSIEIVKQANVIVSTPRGGLVETNRSDGREVLLNVRLVNVMVEDTPTS